MKTIYLILFLFISNLVIAQKCDSTILLTHLKTLVEVDKPRNDLNVESLDFVADYIHSEFSKYSKNVAYQPFTVNKKEYKNVICSFGPKNAERIVIGAHYDVCYNQPGADDNASGVLAP